MPAETKAIEKSSESLETIFDPFDFISRQLPLSNLWDNLASRGWPQRTAERNLIRVEEVLEDEALVIRAELPGVDFESDLEVLVDDNILTINAKREEREEQPPGGFRSEFRYGSFVRTVSLPEGSDAHDISAQYHDGILEIRVPYRKPKRSEPTAVKVERRLEPQTK